MTVLESPINHSDADTSNDIIKERWDREEKK